MNIQLNQDNVELVAIDEDGKFFQITENIGFTDENGKQGFNRADAGEDDGQGGTIPLYLDGSGNPYPKLRQAVFAVLPYLNVFEGDDIKMVNVLTSIERSNEELTDGVGDSIEVDYKDVAYTHEISINGEGYYTAYLFLIDAVDPDAGDQLPVTGVYYNKSTKKFLDASDSQELDLADLIDRQDVSYTNFEYMMTPNLERKLHDIVGEMADASMLHGNCSKEYLSARRAAFFMEGQLAGAHVKFNDGQKMKAQQIIEDLENTDPYAEF